MSRDGVHQWFPRGRGWAMGASACWVLVGVWNLVDAVDLVDVVLAVLLLVFAAWWTSASFSYRVRSDGEGLQVRGSWWRTQTVPWSEIVDIQPGSRWNGTPLVVVTRDGKRVSTHLRAADHPGLVSHWRVMTAQATLEDYVTAGYDGSR